MCGPGAESLAVLAPGVDPGTIPGCESISGDPGHLADSRTAHGLVPPSLGIIEVDPAPVLGDEERRAEAFDLPYRTGAQSLVPVAVFIVHVDPATGVFNAGNLMAA